MRQPAKSIPRLLSLCALAVLVGLPAGAAEKFVFMTDWVAQAEQGGFYQALAEGLYAKRGLEVEIRPGGTGMDPQKLLAAGSIDGAMASSGFFTLNLIDVGAPVVTVAAMFQKDPTILMSHPRSDVTSLADMKGKPIHIGDPSVNTMWRWLASRYGYSDIQIRKYSFNIAPFLVDKSAIQQGYVTSEPFTAEKAGVKPQVFLLADNGFASYSAMIMVRKDVLTRREAVVKAFVEASIEGWYHFLTRDPAAAYALIKKQNPDIDDATLANARQKIIEYGLVTGGDAATQGVGYMSAERWQKFTKEMKDLGIYPQNLDWRQGVDLRFVDKGQGLALKP
ncbi:ABC transporter substrate-binding protein [Niveispirillum sp. SYP-B3756]|uniref:ABC transporter substrate-binding protein n=1 Tax=Niveispirillum sp. SYP-B3756 TaxID=2662178 RepID=UPI001292309A|nr:ABC transporter substrate-binding protein [Niveispirillum sp. SYP-B3756]MQP66143.1 ABC transporter substrate-binding protein [Niveispirillum sp. SYP-B3756]